MSTQCIEPATRRGRRTAASLAISGALLASLTVGTLADTAGAQPARPVTSDAVDTAMGNLVRAAQRYWQPRAMRIELWRNGQRVFEHSQGLAYDGEPVDERSPMIVGSISKTLTAMTTLRLAQLGKIDIDRPLLAQWRAPVRPRDPRFARITPRMLMQHTSGLPSAHGLFFTNRGRDWHPRVAPALRYSLLFSPGRGFRYSTAGPILQAALIEQVTGMDYADAVREYVLEPLRIRTGVLIGKNQNFTGRAARYALTNSNYLANLGPAGGWTIAAGDVAKLAIALRDGGPLYNDRTLAVMRQVWRPTNAYYRWGVGVMIYTRGGAGIGHTGNVYFGRALMRAYNNGYTLVMQGSVTVAPSSIQMLYRINRELTAIGALS